MRYIGIQLLTWGTVAGAIGSALVLAALDSPLEAKLADLPKARWSLSSPPAPAGRPNKDRADPARARTPIPDRAPRAVLP